MKYLEEEIRGNKYFGGENIGFVDLALGLTANLVGVFEEIIGLKIIDKERFPCLVGWMEEFAEAPVIKESWPPHDRLLVKFQDIHQRYVK